MKNKKLLYGMIFLIALVWGIVFYQLFSYMFSKETYALPEEKSIINIEEIRRDTFSIVANYRDPFLGKKALNQMNYAKKKGVGKKKKVVVPPKAEKPWPTISYSGMIKNNNKDRRVGIVKINGKEYLVKKNDVIYDVTFMEITKEAVKVVFQKETKKIDK